MKSTGNPPLNGVLPGDDRSRAALMNVLTPRQWLLLGIAFTALVGMRWNVSWLAWVMPVPFLLYLRSAHGWRAQLWLLAALQLVADGGVVFRAPGAGQLDRLRGIRMAAPAPG